MDNLIQYILAAYNATGSIPEGQDEPAPTAIQQSAPGGMWLSRAPETVRGTFITFTIVSSAESHAMGTGVSTADVQVQFNVCAPDTASNAVTAANDLRTLLLDQVDTAGNIRYARTLDAGVLEKDPDSLGYIYRIVFRFIIGI